MLDSKKKIAKKMAGVQRNVLLANYTTYKIGGPAKYFLIAKTKEELLKAIKIAKEFNLPIFILGGGSNILISDKGFSGLVIKIENSDIKIEGRRVFVGAGASLIKLSYLLADNGLSGLEWVAGVPGTIGGAIHGNAHAFNSEIGDVVESVEIIDAKTLKIKKLIKKQCKFSSKDSVFKKNKNLIIISAVLTFRKKDKKEVKNKIRKFLDYRRQKHPTKFPSAGSVFINPKIVIKDKKTLEKFPEIKEYNKKGYLPAGYLIERVGLAGKKIGNAKISDKHANFIINLGGAKAKDVLALIELARKKVKKFFGINLEPEIQLIGFDKI